MRPDQREPFPFEPRLALPGERTCGAAALAMVYRSLGLEATQEAIWRAVARPDGRGTRDARTSGLAADAISRGLEAACIEADRPWWVLRELAARRVRVILNHRVRPDSPLGHFSVLTQISQEVAVLHDPAAGPGRRLSRDALLALWTPLGQKCEIAGNVLVAVARSGSAVAQCGACAAPLAPNAPCPRCGAEVVLRPFAALGCVRAGCPARLWRRIFCPRCDRGTRSWEAGRVQVGRS